MTNSIVIIKSLAVAATLTGLAALSGAAQAQSGDHDPSQELLGAAEVGYAPFMFPQPDGTLEGFNFDMSTEIAKRMGRPGFKVADVPWPNIFAGLYANRYEYIAAPVSITEKRAAEMLFGEPYLDVKDAFLTRKDNRFESTDDLKGKKIGVVSGSVQDDWMTDNADQYGIEVLRFDSTPDALQAVVIGRADSHMTGALAGLWLVKSEEDFAVDLTLPASGQLGLAFRPDDAEFRNEVERHLECMKLDGTLASFYEKWFGAEPETDSSTVTTYPGFGAPGWNGHDPEPHDTDCPEA